jgi:DNA-binding SARP family transcriptional activator
VDLDTALAIIPDDEPRARAALRSLWDEAEQRGDTTSAWQIAAVALLTINFEFIDFRGSAHWCARFAAGVDAAWANHLAERARSGEPAALRGCAGVLARAMQDHAAIDDAEGRTMLAEASDALAEGLRVETTLTRTEHHLLAKCLLDHYGQQMDTLAAARLMALEQEKLRHGTASPGLQANWWFTTMCHHEYYGDAEAARQARHRLQPLLETHELPGLRFALLTLDMPVALKAGQLGRAERIHRELEAQMPDMSAGYLPQALRAQAQYLSQRGEYAAALARIDRLLAVCADVEVPVRDQGAYRVLRANVLAALGRFDEALIELRGQRPFQLGAQGETLEVLILFAEAAARLDHQPDSALDYLRQALPGAVSLQFNRFFFTVPRLAARLCQAALDARIETEFVRATIRDRHLSAPDPTRPDWPWRLRVQVLGELSIWRDELPLRSAGKAQRKPLELLALLAAHGGGPVDARFIIDALWPSLDADAPKASLEMAVSRLRKLLDLPEAVLVADGAVALDPALVWCDAGAFETLADQLQHDLTRNIVGVETSLRAERLFALYRDRLLGSETLGGSMQMARERLALCYHRVVTAWGTTLEARGDWAATIALYERALTRDVLAEPIYRALMRGTAGPRRKGRSAAHLPTVPGVAGQRAVDHAGRRDAGPVPRSLALGQQFTVSQAVPSRPRRQTLSLPIQPGLRADAVVGDRHTIPGGDVVDALQADRVLGVEHHAAVRIGATGDRPGGGGEVQGLAEIETRAHDDRFVDVEHHVRLRPIGLHGPVLPDRVPVRHQRQDAEEGSAAQAMGFERALDLDAVVQQAGVAGLPGRIDHQHIGEARDGGPHLAAIAGAVAGPHPQPAAGLRLGEACGAAGHRVVRLGLDQCHGRREGFPALRVFRLEQRGQLDVLHRHAAAAGCAGAGVGQAAKLIGRRCGRCEQRPGQAGGYGDRPQGEAGERIAHGGVPR